jgi:hypothetical protein
MSSNPNDPVITQIQRVIEIPGLMEKPLKQRKALRVEKKTLERKIEKREALILKELLDFEDYKACKNGDERKALYTVSKHSDVEWEKFQDRHEQIYAALESIESELEQLKREQYSCWAAIEARLEGTLRDALNDRVLADAMKGSRVTRV